MKQFEMSFAKLGKRVGEMKMAQILSSVAQGIRELESEGLSADRHGWYVVLFEERALLSLRPREYLTEAFDTNNSESDPHLCRCYAGHKKRLDAALKHPHKGGVPILFIDPKGSGIGLHWADIKSLAATFGRRQTS